MFFDERFNFISAEDGGVAQQQVASSWKANNQVLGLAAIKAPKNGYAYVYVSNRSDQNVYFDNFLVGNVAGNIIEENHYYAYGLKISAISSRKLGDANEGKLKNAYLYNGKEMLDEDADLNWSDYGFRNYDPQIGRFPQLDPLTDDYPLLSPYLYAFNDPITNIDEDGLNGCPSVAGLSGYVGNVGSALSGSASAFVSTASIIVSVLGTSSSVLLSAGSFVNTNSTQDIVREQNAGNAVNGQNSTIQVGKVNVNSNSHQVMSKGGDSGISDLWQELTNDYITDVVKLKKIQTALFNASVLLVATLNELKRWNAADKLFFKSHFGADDNSARDLILGRVRGEYNLIVKFLENNNFKERFYETSAKGSYAHVYSEDGDFKIYLDELFWRSNATGTDSQAGTIIHELSHFRYLSKDWRHVDRTKDTDANGDKIYGIPDVRKLILTDPWRALRHADTFEYYLEKAF
jgi:RHS repeat-associated protein